MAAYHKSDWERGADVGQRVRPEGDIVFIAIDRREELDRLVGMTSLSRT